MASLGMLALGTYTNISSTAIQGSDPVLEVLNDTSPPDDTDYAYDSTNSTHEGSAKFTLADMPANFASMATVAIQLRYGNSGTPVNTWSTLSAQIFKSNGTTALTNKMTIASSITATTPTDSSVISCTGLDTAATKTDWDGAVVVIYWNITKVKSGDTVQKRVYGAEVTGTYNTGDKVATPGVGSLTLTGFAATVFVSNLINITPGTGTLDLVGYAPTVSVSNHKNVSPGTGALVLEGYLAEVSPFYNTGWLDAIGVDSTEFANPENVYESDNYYTSDEVGATSGNIQVQLFDGTSYSDAKTEVLVEVEERRIFGTGIDSWGNYTPDILSNLQVIVKYEDSSIQLPIYGFNFSSIPQYSIIKGYNVAVEYYYDSNNDILYIDHIQLFVYYQKPYIIAVDVGTLTLTGFAPTVAISDHKNITAGVGSLVLDGYAPTIEASNHINVVPDIGQLILEGFVPNIEVTFNQFVSPGLGELLLTGYEPITSISDNKNVQPDVATLDLIGFEPTVEAASNIVVNPSLGELLLTGFESTVSISDNKNIIAGLGELILIGFEPTVFAGDVINVTPGLGELVFTGFEPVVAVTNNKNTQPGLGELLLIGFEPTIAATDNINTQPGLGELILTGYAPTTDIPTDKVVYPSTGQLTITGYAPTVQDTALLFYWDGTNWIELESNALLEAAEYAYAETTGILVCLQYVG